MKRIGMILVAMLVLVACREVYELQELTNTSESRISLPEACATTRVAVCMTSDPADFVLQGRTITAKESEVTVQGDAIQVKFDNWFIDLKTNSQAEIKPGWYPEAQRYPFQESGHPGLAIVGEGRGCNEVEGAFEINTFVQTENKLILEARFVQHCEGAAPALYGWIRIGE